MHRRPPEPQHPALVAARASLSLALAALVALATIALLTACPATGG